MKNKLLISFLIFISLGSNIVFSNELEDAANLYNQAIDLYKQDNVEKSIELFNQAIQIKPDFYEAHYNLAQILMSLDKNDEAYEVLEKLLKIKPNDSETLYNIGKTQYKRGYLLSSHEYLVKIPKEAPQYESAKLLISKIETRQKELNLEAKIKEHKISVDSMGKTKGVELSEIAAPSGVAVDSRGNIYVASFAENAIYKISIYGKKIVFSNSPLIKGPIGVAVDKNDNVYVANYLTNNLLKISSNGQATILADIEKPYCVYYDSEHNRIYVTEQETNKLFKFDI